MAISETERRSWTAPGAQDAAQATYKSIKAALDRSTELAGLDWEPFLQGSYANHTNVRADSDVDVVVMLKSTYLPDTSRLSAVETARYERRRSVPRTTLADFRGMVQRALVSYYGSARVHSKDKCLRVDKNSGYVDADVVPALQHRLFTSYPEYGEPQFIEGIAIRPLSGGWIVNYPKVHRSNGSQKNDAALQRYKPTVRQVKRLRRRAVDLNLVRPADAPGYLLECLVYNVPNSHFLADDSARMPSVLGWLHNLSAADLAAQCWSCDRVHHLFVDDPGKHNQYTAERVLGTLWRLL